jgi:hypothetical protein
MTRGGHRRGHCIQLFWNAYRLGHPGTLGFAKSDKNIEFCNESEMAESVEKFLELLWVAMSPRKRKRWSANGRILVVPGMDRV